MKPIRGCRDRIFGPKAPGLCPKNRKKQGDNRSERNCDSRPKKRRMKLAFDILFAR
jgi:hypothetical protein